MSTTVTDSSTTTMKIIPALGRDRIFWWSFGVVLIFNLILTLTVYTLGVTTGYEGEASLSWEAFATSAARLFGGLGSLVLTVLILSVIAGILFAVHRLSARGHHTMVVVTFVIAVIIGWLFLDRLLDNMAAFTFGFIPFVALVVFSALEALAIKSIPSRKRGNIH